MRFVIVSDSIRTVRSGIYTCMKHDEHLTTKTTTRVTKKHSFTHTQLAS